MRYGAFIALLVLLTLSSSVSAAPLPPTLITFDETVSDVVIFRDLIESGDLLVLAEYNIVYATQPVDSTAVNFLFRLMNGSTTLATNTPYPFQSGGYGKGVVSVYMGEAEVTAASLGAWPFSGLSLDLAGNPTIFTTVPSTTFALASGNYSTGSGQSTNQSQLTTEIIAAASRLQTEWGIDLLTATNVLNTTAGSPYFTQAVSDVRLMAPGAFSISTEAPTVPTPVPTPGGAGTLAGQSETRFDGTFWLNPALDSMSETLGLPAGAFAGFLVLMLIIVMGVTGLKMAGPPGGLVGLGIGIVVVLPIVGFYGGFIPPEWALLSIGVVSVVAVLKLAREWVQ